MTTLTEVFSLIVSDVGQEEVAASQPRSGGEVGRLSVASLWPGTASTLWGLRGPETLAGGHCQPPGPGPVKYRVLK